MFYFKQPGSRPRVFPHKISYSWDIKKEKDWTKPVGPWIWLSTLPAFSHHFSSFFYYSFISGLRQYKVWKHKSAELENCRQTDRHCNEWLQRMSCYIIHGVKEMDEDGWRTDKEKNWKMTGQETPCIPAGLGSPSDSWWQFSQPCCRTTHAQR